MSFVIKMTATVAATKPILTHLSHGTWRLRFSHTRGAVTAGSRTCVRNKSNHNINEPVVRVVDINVSIEIRQQRLQVRTQQIKSSAVCAHWFGEQCTLE